MTADKDPHRHSENFVNTTKMTGKKCVEKRLPKKKWRPRKHSTTRPYSKARRNRVTWFDDVIMTL